MRFKIGDKVRIREDSVHYGINYGSPKNTEGIVVEVEFLSSPLIVVEWPVGETNSYLSEDLELAEGFVYEV